MKQDELLIGVAASPGIAIGKAYLLTGDVVKVEERDIDDASIDEEIEKYKTSLEATKEELAEIQSKAQFHLGQEGVKLLDVYQMILDDSFIVTETVERIKTEKKNADFIYYQVMHHFQESLESADNEDFTARATDIRDVKRRVIRHIQGKKHSFLNHMTEKSVIVARELTPLDTVQLEKGKVLAFATDMGGRTSHAAIMAQSLQIPAVMGLKDILAKVRNGDVLIVDGKKGEVIINPGPKSLDKYKKLQQSHVQFTKKYELIRDLPCRTMDGKDIELAANIEFPEDIHTVINYGAKGIGLYRTEYLYLAKDEPPSEEEEYQEYYTIAQKMYPQPVIIRTLDIGGDKKPRCMHIPEEQNPFLGLRAIRLCLERQDIFRAQLRAILRASSLGNIKILLPMISCVDEVLQTKEILTEIKKELKKNKIAFDSSIPIGVMIEVPSAAVLADIIAKEVNFLSIGTNDLIQYMLAVDRGNERVAHLYRTYSLAMLRTIKNIIYAGHQHGVWVGMCGEMAGDPRATLLLLGLGLDEFSVTPAVLPAIKTIIRSISFKEAEHIANKILQQPSSAEAEKLLFSVTQKRFSEFI